MLLLSILISFFNGSEAGIQNFQLGPVNKNKTLLSVAPSLGKALKSNTRMVSSFFFFKGRHMKNTIFIN